MSIGNPFNKDDNAGIPLEPTTPAEPTQSKKTRTAKIRSPFIKDDSLEGTKVRKHHVTTVYRGETAAKLDKLHTEGHTVLAITVSGDIRGFEIISYTEE